MEKEVLISLITGATSLIGIVVTAKTNIAIERAKTKRESDRENNVRTPPSNKPVFKFLIFTFMLILIGSIIFIIGYNFSQKKESSFTGEARFETVNGTSMRTKFVKNRDIKTVQLLKYGNYYFSEIYKSGVYFRLFLKNKENVYVYVINANSEMNINVIHPSKDGSKILLNSEDYEIVIPDEINAWQIANSGTDTFCILLSKHELNIQDIRLRIEKETHKSITDRISAVLSEQLVPVNKIKYDLGEIKYYAKSSKSILPIFVTIEYK